MDPDAVAFNRNDARIEPPSFRVLRVDDVAHFHVSRATRHTRGMIGRGGGDGRPTVPGGTGLAVGTIGGPKPRSPVVLRPAPPPVLLNTPLPPQQRHFASLAPPSSTSSLAVARGVDDASRRS